MLRNIFHLRGAQSCALTLFLRYVMPALISMFFVLLALVYGTVMPPLEAADEAGHVLYIHNLLADGSLPRIESRETLAQQPQAVRRWAVENHQPPLYYTLGALLIVWTDRSNIESYLRPNDLIFIRGINDANHHVWMHNPDMPPGDTSTAIWMLRLYSIALGVGTLWFVYLAARQVFASAVLPLLAMLLVASNPTFVSISASVNNDNLVTMLYAMGVYLALRTWRRQSLTNGDIAALSLTLATAGLAKVTGLSLYAVIYLAVLIGVRRRYYPLRRALILVAVSLAVFLVFAGWWYVRNLTLYGDLLALQATQSLWSREYEIAATSGDLLAELRRIGQSFWMMVGHLHQPVYGSGWLYGYAAVMTTAGMVGVFLYLVDAWKKTGLVGAQPVVSLRLRRPSDAVLLLVAVCLVVAAMLLVGTRSIDISYGRLLFPALVGFAPLMVLGWRQIFGRWIGASVILPFAVMALVFPLKSIATAYPLLVPVDSVPEGARTIDVQVESLQLLAYEIEDDTVKPGDHVRLTFFLRGRHPDNLAVVVSALDLMPTDRIGQIEVYPGMAATDSLNPDQIYRAELRIPLDNVDEPLPPNRVPLRLVWYSPAPYREIPLSDAADNTIETLLLEGPTLVDPRYDAPEPDFETDVVFGEGIALDGYSVRATHASPLPGDTLTITLHWRALDRMRTDYTLTVQLLDENGQLVTQADGMPYRYPTSAWRKGVRFADERVLTIPQDTPPGEYQLAVGWYHPEDFTRLPTTARDGSTVEHNLLLIPQRIAP